MTQLLQPTRYSLAADGAPSGTRRYPDSGRFVWHDLMTTDVRRAVHYYGALLGWTTEVVEVGPMGSYTMVRVGDTAIGGMVQLDPAQGIASHWLSYLAVDDVDATCALAPEAGGQVAYPPTDLPEVGRFAVLEDASGALWSPLRMLEPAPAPAWPIPTGHFCWEELVTPNVLSATAFYADVVGWGVRGRELAQAEPYWLWTNGGGHAGASMMAMPAAADAQPFWLPYVLVDDVRLAAASVARLGGTVVRPPDDVPEVGTFTVTRDPMGAPLALICLADGE